MSKEGRPTKAEVFRTMLGDDTTILEGSFMVHGQLLPFWRIMHLILCSSIDPKKHTTELSYSRAEFLYLVVVRGLPVDIASYIYLSIRAEALKTDATISLPHGILLTQFLHAMMVPESGDEPRALPLGSINKTTLSKSIAQTRRALQAARVARRRSAINKENRAKLKIVHTSGARSFQRTRALLKNPESDEISPALLYKKTHTNKDGMWTSEDARENFEKMEALVAVRVRGKVIHRSGDFAEVLGTKAGYVRGLGRSVRSVGSSSSVSSVDLSRRLEEARLQIEEMRARQLEYEALLVKGQIWSRRCESIYR
ncbi:hypothetical protein CJ030_MR3G007330 [Morella rubra]|uniref:Uncharacterized protein n=1 Tax=Morella rubra TaxID=262757 RepID=A0A6A1W0V9_9ROSI|nr:hypothetical protein CJ030_MR3G007330 [Morella rubra]